MRIQDTAAIITGGASGLGGATAARLAKAVRRKTKSTQAAAANRFPMADAVMRR